MHSTACHVNFEQMQICFHRGCGGLRAVNGEVASKGVAHKTKITISGLTCLWWQNNQAHDLCPVRQRRALTCTVD